MVEAISDGKPHLKNEVVKFVEAKGFKLPVRTLDRMRQHQLKDCITSYIEDRQTLLVITSRGRHMLEAFEDELPKLEVPSSLIGSPVTVGIQPHAGRITRLTVWLHYPQPESSKQPDIQKKLYEKLVEKNGKVRKHGPTRLTVAMDEFLSNWALSA